MAEFLGALRGSRLEKNRHTAADTIGALASSASFSPLQRVSKVAAEVLTTSSELGEQGQAELKVQKQTEDATIYYLEVVATEADLKTARASHPSMSSLEPRTPPPAA